MGPHFLVKNPVVMQWVSQLLKLCNPSIMLQLTWLGRQPWSCVRWRAGLTNLGSLRGGQLLVVLYFVGGWAYWFRLLNNLLFCTFWSLFFDDAVGDFIQAPVINKRMKLGRFLLRTVIAHFYKVGGEDPHSTLRSSLPPAILHLPHELHHLVNFKL